MENQNNNFDTQPTETVMEIKPRRVWWKFAVGAVIILILAGGGYWAWDKYFSPQARKNAETQANYQKYLDWQKSYEAAMTADTYGGKTPQETLDMFIDVLKKGDIELASKYFLLREDGSVDPKWVEGISKTKETGKLVGAIDLLTKAKPAGSVMSGYFGFEVRDDNGELVEDISMRLNKYSGVWKIESL